MMRAFARRLIDKRVAWAIVIVTLIATALAGWQATKVDQDDDVLKFLPKGNVDVAQFREINKRFGGLDVALVGIEVDDPFDRAFLDKLRTLTKRLNQESSVGYALSLANVKDFTKEKVGGIRTAELVDVLPENEPQKAALRARVMSRDHIVGVLLSADAKSILIYNFGKPGHSPRDVAAQVKARVDEAFPDLPKYWGGAPFVSTYIYDITQQDVRRLTPWAILVKLIIVVLAFRNVVAVLLTVVAAGIAIAITQGLMGATGVPANVVLGSLPVILFALGSAYATHVVVQYFSSRAAMDTGDAIEATFEQVGAPVFGAGLITAAGLFSFLVMDVVPLRHFGLFAGIGILVTLLLSLTFVPAVLALTGARSKPLGADALVARLGRLVRAVTQRRAVVAIGLAAVTAIGAFLTSRVDARMESSAFFAKDSPPDRAERFLRDRFGGSQFIQLAVDGDMNSADVLREVQRLGDEISLLPHVSNVTHIGQVVAITNDAIGDGERRIPPTREQILPLYRFLADDPAVRQLVTTIEDPDKGALRDHAVVIAKIDTDRHEDVGELLGRIEELIAKRALRSYRVIGGKGAAPTDERTARLRELVTAHVRSLLRSFDVKVPDVAAVAEGLKAPPPKPDAGAVQTRLAKLITTNLPKTSPDTARAIAREVTPLGPAPSDQALTAAIAKATGADEDDDDTEDLADGIGHAVSEAWRPELSLGRARQLLQHLGVAAPEGDRGERLQNRIADALLDLENQTALVATDGSGDGKLAYTVSGVPVLNRGLSMSVRANQFKSLGMSLGLVLLIMIALYRSATAGLLGVAPTALTLLTIYGAMSLLGLHLEIGTSMLACLVIGAGVDYGVHLLARWRSQKDETLASAAEHAATHSGFASWTNAVMVSAGFFVLTLGQARPLKTVGGLTGAAMLVAALATFVVIPALARRTSYARETSGEGTHLRA
jgi:predicted RND superfamily exporter protein